MENIITIGKDYFNNDLSKYFEIRNLNYQKIENDTLVKIFYDKILDECNSIIVLTEENPMDDDTKILYEGEFKEKRKKVNDILNKYKDPIGHIHSYEISSNDLSGVSNGHKIYYYDFKDYDEIKSFILKIGIKVKIYTTLKKNTEGMVINNNINGDNNNINSDNNNINSDIINGNNNNQKDDFYKKLYNKIKNFIIKIFK